MWDYRIRMIATDGTVSTVAGSGISGYLDGYGINSRFQNVVALAVSSTGDLYVSDGPRIRVINATRYVSTFVGCRAGFTFSTIYSLAFDYDGNLLVGENYRILSISPTGYASIIAGTGTSSASVINGLSNNSTFNGVQSMTVARDGSIYVADFGNNMIRKIERITR